jgi:hypothetical protein
MEPVRKFKIIVNSKECGTCSGLTPSAVAKKVIKKLCGTSSKMVKFSLKECKSGCERVCGPYQGRMEKLDRPYKRGRKTITHQVVCGKVRKMRGGDLGRDGELLMVDDFYINSDNPSFFKKERIEKTKEQYIFFDKSYLNSTDRSNFYKYVAIRKKGKIFKQKEVIFKKNDIQEIINIDINDIDLSILLKLYEEIKEQNIVAKSIYDTLEHYIIGITEKILRNNSNSISKLASLFQITEIEPSTIKFFSFKNNVQLIFFHIIDRNHSASYYQYVIIIDKDKRILLKKCEDNYNVSNIIFEDFLNRGGNQENYDHFQILYDLLDDINKLIQERNVHFDFSIIQEKLTEILKSKIVSNSDNNTKLIPYFNIKQKSNTAITVYEFGSKTSALFGDKYQYIFFNIIDRNRSSSYYQYVIIRDNNKTISLKQYDGETSVSNIDFEQFIKNHDNFEILQELLDNINKLIQEQEFPFNFATTIREKLTEILKSKIVSNSDTNTMLIPYFNIKRKSNKAITVFEFGSKTSVLFGNKYQFIFFNIIDRNNSSSYYQYVIIRDNRQKISLKQYDGENSVSGITFEEILRNKNREGYIILEKLYRDIQTISNQRSRSNFATTIRKVLGDYIYGDKLDPELTPTSFEIQLIRSSLPDTPNNIKNINIKEINGIRYIFFCIPTRLIKIIRFIIVGKNDTIEKYSEFRNKDNYYMFVVFLNEKGINFYQLIEYKGTSLIVYINNNIMSMNAMTNLLEYLYTEINLLYDNTNGNQINSFYLKMLNSLEEYIIKLLKKERDLELLRSRYFYIPEKELQNNNKDFNIKLINDKTYIFFYRCKGKRIFSQLSPEYILYKYLIIINERNINFYKIRGKENMYSVFIREPVKIEVENLFENIDRLLLGILYGHLLKYIHEHNNISGKIKKDIQKLLNLFKFGFLKINEYYEFIKYFSKVLTSNINGSLITINGRPVTLEYNGTFDFDFLRNKRNNEIFQNILDKLLRMHDIRKNYHNNRKFHFKPHIKKIVNNKLIMSNIKLIDNSNQIILE